MLRAFYRSLLFWLGIPCLLFLLWAWADSTQHSFLLRRSAPTSDVVFFHWRGGVAMCRANLAYETSSVSFSVTDRTFLVGKWRRGAPSGRSSSPTWSFLRFDPQDYGNAALERRSFEDGSTTWSAFIPYWLIIVTYLAVWIAALVGWQRRKSRLLKLHATPLP